MKLPVSLAPDWIAKVALCMLAFAAVMTSYMNFAMAAPSRPITILAFGDSLTAGYGVQPGDSFPAKHKKAHQAKGHKVTITNAGVSGDTTSGGLQRLDWALDPKPDAVIMELGANDALRGIDPKVPRANLAKKLAD